jgi:hypothetical protein
MLGLGNSLTTSGIMEHFLPTQVNDLQIWLQNGVGVTAAKWDDSSGNSNDITQGTPGTQATATDGGLDFASGNSDHYDLDSDISIASEGSLNLFVVMRVDGGTSAIFGNSGTQDFIELQTHKQLRFTFDDATAEKIEYGTNELFNAGSPFKALYHFQRTAGANSGSGTTAKINFFKNGTEVSGSPTSGNDGYDDGAITIDVVGTRTGSDRFFDGLIFELLIYKNNSSDMAADDITSVTNYLTSKHGI